MNDPAPLDSVAYKRSLVIGMLLGNATARTERLPSGTLRAELVLKQRLQQLDYLQWKVQELERTYRKSVAILIQQHQNLARCTFVQSGRMRVMSTWFYHGSTKVISEKIRFMNHPIGLAVLLGDLGRVAKRKATHQDGTIYFMAPRITLATESYDHASVVRLLEHVKALCGAQGVLKQRGQEAGHQMVFQAEATSQLWRYAGPWMPPVPSLRAKWAFAYERLT